jgi:DNA-binding winged helix-turn-helix (wHTH) protein
VNLPGSPIPQQSMRYVFGEFSLDTERFDLSRAGQSVRVRHKTISIFAPIISQREQVVPSGNRAINR